MADIFEKRLKSTRERIAALPDVKYKLGFITDVHTGGNNHVEHLREFSDMVVSLGYDVAVNGGDIGLDLGEDSERAREIIKKTRAYMTDKIPFLYCKGNHDYGRTAQITNREITGALLTPCKEKYGNALCLHPDGYGYFDKSGVRAIFLNTTDCDGGDCTMSPEQVRFLIEALEGLRDGGKAIVLSHFCLDVIGKWNSYPGPYDSEWNTAVRKMLRDFVHKRDGAHGSFSWSFADTKGSLVCCLSGDSHFNNHINRDGVWYVVRQGYGGVDSAELSEGASYDRFSANHQSECRDYCFETLVIYGTNKCKLIRTGIAEVTRDLEFEF